MIILTYVLTFVYLIAINFYSFALTKTQQSDQDTCNPQRVNDGKLLFTALLGGALGIFISTFVLNYRKSSMFTMVLMPVLITLNAYVAYVFLTSGINYVF